jgi:hypothetical protein
LLLTVQTEARDGQRCGIWHRLIPASGESSFILGTEIIVDGGISELPGAGTDRNFN